jgi:hypothetical protein
MLYLRLLVVTGEREWAPVLLIVILELVGYLLEV